MNSVLSGRTQLKLSALFRIARLGGSSLPALQAADLQEAASPTRLLRHLAARESHGPSWLRDWQRRLRRSPETGSGVCEPRASPEDELRLVSEPRKLLAVLNLRLGRGSLSADGGKVDLESSSALIRQALFWCRANANLAPTTASVVNVLESVESEIASRPALSWLRPEALLSATECLAAAAPGVIAAAPGVIAPAIQEVVHAAVIEEQRATLAAALLLDAEVALKTSHAQRADRILRSLARHLEAETGSSSLSDSRVFPLTKFPGQTWLEESPVHCARLLLASAWRHLALGDYSRSLAELDRLRQAAAGGMRLPRPFAAQAAWTRSVIARDTGQLPQMEHHLSSAAKLDKECMPVCSSLAQIRRLAYFWRSGQRSRFQTAIHQDLGTMAGHLGTELSRLILQIRSGYCRGDLIEHELADVESALADAAERATPWS